MGEIVGIIIIIVVLVAAYKLVEYCYARFPLQYSIFLLVGIGLKFFLCKLVMGDFLSCFFLEFFVMFFYITQVEPHDYDTIETTTSYNSWRDRYEVSSQRVHHHTPAWVRKLLGMAIFAAIGAAITNAFQGGALIVLILEAIIPAIRAWNAWNYIKNNQNKP